MNKKVIGQHLNNNRCRSNNSNNSKIKSSRSLLQAVHLGPNNRRTWVTYWWWAAAEIIRCIWQEMEMSSPMVVECNVLWVMEVLRQHLHQQYLSHWETRE
jgi:hypothetical protein